jgi:hypothetical protein
MAVRVMMSCRTGGIERAQVEGVLAEMGWCPNHPEGSEYLRGKMERVLARLPDPVRAELASTDPVLITTFPNVWGLASFDRRHLLMLCLLGDDLDVVKQQCTQIAVNFPRTFARVLDGRECDFDPHVEIRRFDGNGLVTRGIISTTRHVPFRRYVWAVRRRERVILLALTALFALSTAAALLLYLRFPGGDWTYVRGYLDRISSAVLTAGLITFVNLVFEYRDWKGATAVIEWSLPVL